MIPNKNYEIMKRIKVHTSPLREVDVVQVGRFVKETKKSYMFDNFRVKKELVIHIEETGCD